MAPPVLHVEQLKISETESRRLIADNLAAIENSVESSATSVGRSRDDIRIVGVTKYVDSTITSWLVDAGCHDLGENRPQTLMEKFASTDLNVVRWHQVGHLQRNKVRKLVTCQPVIHSIDSVRILDEVYLASSQQNQPVEMLLEVNVGGEDAKTGLQPVELSSVLQHWLSLNTDQASVCKIIGLMAMAPLGHDGDAARPFFAKLRQLREDLSVEFSIPLPELSMGMSGDYAAAIAEGATMVRIGSSLFRGLL